MSLGKLERGRLDLPNLKLMTAPSDCKFTRLELSLSRLQAYSLYGVTVLIH